jgi:hypothetical protein
MKVLKNAIFLVLRSIGFITKGRLVGAEFVL